MSTADSPSVPILVIDSDPLILTGIAAILDQAGYECYCARGGQAALKSVGHQPPDLIVCDTELEGECGLMLVRELRMQPALLDVPVLFTSMSGDPALIDRSRASGGSYYLRKPFDPWVLMELVDRALWMPALVATSAAHSGAARPNTAHASLAADTLKFDEPPSGAPLPRMHLLRQPATRGRRQPTS